jgi:outer membrane protein assembly factor BamD (BamD/ComL family)
MTANFSTKRPEGEFQTAAVLMKEKKYGEAIALYRKISAESPGTQVAANAQYHIGLAYAFHDNTEKNCATAIQEFENFLRLNPSDSSAVEAQNWIATLKINLELKKQNEALKKESEQLRKSIEELKRLDIRHEERRRK